MGRHRRFIDGRSHGASMSGTETTPDRIEKIARRAFPEWFAMTRTSGGAAACHIVALVIAAIIFCGGRIEFAKRDE